MVRLVVFLFLVVCVSACGGSSETSPAPSPIQEKQLELITACESLDTDFTVMRGSLSMESGCGTFLATTDASSSGAYSTGRYEFNQVVTPYFELSVKEKRITSDINRPTEVYFLGGAFGFANGNYYLYESETHWTGWLASPLIVLGENKITVVQNDQLVKVYVNDEYLDSFVLDSPITANKVSIFFKGDPGMKSQMQFSEFSLHIYDDGNGEVLDGALNTSGLFEVDEQQTLKTTLKDLEKAAMSLQSNKTYAFGNVNIYQEKTIPVTITNSSKSSYNMFFATLSNSTDFSLKNGFLNGDCGMFSQLMPNKSCKMYVSFHPTQAGTKNGTISVSNNSASYIVALTGKAVAANKPIATTLSGVSKPLDSKFMGVASDIFKFGAKNKYMGTHKGVDFMTENQNPVVLSIAPGKVVYNSTNLAKYKTPFAQYWNGFLIVEHNVGSTKFYAYYGHVSSNFKVGDSVSQGVQIATVRDAYVSAASPWTSNTSNNHLHLSISETKKWITSGWGRGKNMTINQIIKQGFVDPLAYFSW